MRGVAIQIQKLNIQTPKQAGGSNLTKYLTKENSSTTTVLDNVETILEPVEDDQPIVLENKGTNKKQQARNQTSKKADPIEHRFNMDEFCNLGMVSMGEISKFDVMKAC